MGPTFEAIRRSWARHFLTQISAIVILTATYTASLFILQSATGIKNVFYVWGKISQATVYLQSDIHKEKLSEIVTTIEKSSLVGSVKFVSQKDAAKDFSSRYKKFLPATVGAEKMQPFFPKTLHIELLQPIRSQQDSERFSLFATTLKRKFSKVEDVSFGQSWMAKYVRLIGLYERFSYILALTIFLASLFITSNVLKTVLFSRKEELEILELVGATPFWVYSPHILNCLILSSLSFIFSLFINHAAYSLIGEHFSGVFSQSSEISSFAISGELLLLVFGILLFSVVGSSLLTMSKMLPNRIVYNNRREKRLKSSLGRET